MVFARDNDSLNTAKELLGGHDNCKLQFSHDMAFALESHINEKRIPAWLARKREVTPLIGLNVSGLLYMGGYTTNNMFGLKTDYRRLMTSLIDHFVQKHNAHIMLVPHVLGDQEDGESDVIACGKVYGENKEKWHERVYFLNAAYNEHELKALIGRCDFFIGSRMHACIAALSQRVPAVGLAYSRKFRGVFESIRMETLVIDLRTQNENSIIDHVSRHYENRRHLCSQLETTIPTVQTSVLGLFT